MSTTALANAGVVLCVTCDAARVLFDENKLKGSTEPVDLPLPLVRSSGRVRNGKPCQPRF